MSFTLFLILLAIMVLMVIRISHLNEEIKDLQIAVQGCVKTDRLYDNVAAVIKETQT